MILWWAVNKFLSVSPRMIFDLCVSLIFLLFLQFPWREIQILPVQWHSICLGLFASVIAPFGGFFASGFKRAFKIKVNLLDLFLSLPSITFSSWKGLQPFFSFISQDFGDSIPGHGGITDRMDCQVTVLVILLPWFSILFVYVIHCMHCWCPN